MYHLSSYVGQRVVAVWPRRTVRGWSAPASPRPGMSAEPGLTTDGTSVGPRGWASVGSPPERPDAGRRHSTLIRAGL